MYGLNLNSKRIDRLSSTGKANRQIGHLSRKVRSARLIPQASPVIRCRVKNENKCWFAIMELSSGDFSGRLVNTETGALLSTSSCVTKTSKEVVTPKAGPSHVRVGVGVLVKDPLNPRNVFAGTRKGSHGAGSLALPGGHLEMYESWEDCAAREVEEEMGLQLINVTFGHVTNDPMPLEGKHYITIFMMAEFADPNALPRNCEPHKCEGWKSFSWNELREIHDAYSKKKEDGLRLFGPLNQLMKDEPEMVLQFLN